MMLMLVAPLALCACGAPAPAEIDNRPAEVPVEPATTATTTQPAQAADPSGDKADGAARTIALADGQSVTIEPFRAVEKEGLSDSQCGVTIAGQRLMTMGTGETEVYSCYKLTGAGALPADGDVARIGLLYDVGSPNASFWTAVILRKEAAGWAVDESRAGEFDSKPEAKSIETLAKALR